MKLTSIDALKLHLDIEENTYDDLLGSIIEMVSARIEKGLNRELTKTERTTYFDAGKRFYYLNAYPIDMSVPPVVEVYGVVKTNEADYYVWVNEGLIHFVYSIAPIRPKMVRITWTGGYHETNGVLDVPYDLKRACLIQSAFEFKRRNDTGLSSISMQSGSIGIAVPDSLLGEVNEIVSSYRKYPYA